MDTNNFNTTTTVKTTKRVFKQLTQLDRNKIEDIIKESQKKDYSGPKVTCQYLADIIRVSKSTISRELKRGEMEKLNNKGHWENIYSATRSAVNRKETKERSHYKTKLDKNSEELKYIKKQLRKGSDIKTAIHYYKDIYNKDFPVCEKTLYNYFHKHFLYGLKPYRHKKEKAEKAPKISQKGKNIAERPEEANNRTEFGHWEGDLIVGARGAKKDCLLTLYERVGKFEYAMKIPNKKMESVVQALDKLERKLGTEAFKKIFKSITFDNGIEFRDCEGMERSIDIKTKRTQIYYADPYCSWERGGNERGNRMLRKFFPKKTDFSKVKSYSIYLALCKINYSIRKSLGGTSSLELIKNLKDDVYSIFEKFNFRNIFLEF